MNNDLELYKIVKSHFRNLGNLIWTNIKYFTTIFLSLFTIHIYLLFDPKYQNIGFKLAYFTLPVLNLGVVLVGYFVIKGQFKRFYQWIAVFSKLEDLLGFNTERTSKEILENDKYIFPKDFLCVKGGHLDTKSFVKHQLSWGNRHPTFWKIRALFILFIISSFASIIITYKVVY